MFEEIMEVKLEKKKYSQKTFYDSIKYFKFLQFFALKTSELCFKFPTIKLCLCLF